jgi:DNA repair photolyase
MDLRRQLLELFHPVDVGDEIVPGALLLEVSTELGLRLTLALAQRDVHIEISPASQGGPYAARSPRLFFSYRSGGGEGELPPHTGQALCQALAERAKPREEAFLGQIAEAAQRRETSPTPASKIREVTVDRMLQPTHAETHRYYTLSPYVGCLIGCRFCYAQERLAQTRRLEGLPRVRWGSWLDVRSNAASVLRRELEVHPPGIIKFCPIVSDPYPQVEAQYQLTRQCLEVLRSAPDWTVLLMTRSRLIDRDTALIASLPRAQAGVSLPTLDDTVRQHFEPRAASVADRLGSLKRLKEAGVRTLAVVQPMLPGPIEAFADALASVADSVRLDVLRGEVGAQQDFDDPRYQPARTAHWQTTHLDALRKALIERNVPLWDGEFPPGVTPTKQPAS